MSDRGAAVLTAGGLLVRSGLRRAEAAALRAERANVLRRVDVVRHTWRRRIGHTGAAMSILAGGLLVLYQSRKHEHPGDGRADPEGLL